MTIPNLLIHMSEETCRQTRERDARPTNKCTWLHNAISYKYFRGMKHIFYFWNVTTDVDQQEDGRFFSRSQTDMPVWTTNTLFEIFWNPVDRSFP